MATDSAERRDEGKGPSRCTPSLRLRGAGDVNQPGSYRSHMLVDSRTELVIAVDIAKRLGISPQRVNVLAGGPGFPRPLGKLGRSAVWRWSSVERWARDSGRLPAPAAAE